MPKSAIWYLNYTNKVLFVRWIIKMPSTKTILTIAVVAVAAVALIRRVPQLNAIVFG